MLSFSETRMKRVEQTIIFLVLISASCARNNVNCPAPRAPDNGLNFIFRNGEVLHFRCHPGYRMQGNSVAHCIDNKWTQPAPLCLPITKALNHSNEGRLFNWGVYGDGARRLPLINGIWPPNNLLSVSVAPSAPRVKEEIDIAELRHKQLQELKKNRKQSKGTSKKKKKIPRKNRVPKGFAEFKRKPVEEVVYDASCVEKAYGRSLPQIAPHIPHSFVYAYETKKNKNPPFNVYMEVKYRCFTGYHFLRSRNLFCRNNSWVGKRPRCVKS